MNTQSEHHEPSFYRDTNEPHSKTIWIYGALTLLFLFIVQVVGHFGFLSSKTGENARKQESVGLLREVQLINLQAAEQMQEYKWLDKGKGIVQIPVKRAMDILVEDAGRVPPSSRAATHPEGENQ